MHALGRRAWVRIGGVALSAACIAYFLRQVSHLPTAIDWSHSPALLGLPAAAAAYLGAYLVLSLAWHCLLRSFGLASRPRASMGIYLSAQIAKYLPGNVGQHIGRIYLASRWGLPSIRVGMTLIVEMLLLVVVSGVLAIPLAPMLLARIQAQGVRTVTLLLVALALSLVAVSIAYFFRRHAVVSRMMGHLDSVRRDVWSARGAGWLAAAATLIVVGMVSAASSLSALVLAAIPSAGLAIFAKVVAVFSAAWVIGFVVPGAPAGVGIREAVLLAGLSPILDPTVAMQVTLLLRGLSLVADVIAFAVGSLLLHRGRSSASAGEVP